jgi:hypothetical protein
VAVAAETVATNRLYVESGHTLPHAEWTEAGPGREQVAFFDVTNPKKAKDHGAETRRGPEALQTGQTSNPDLLAPSSDGAR